MRFIKIFAKTIFITILFFNCTSQEVTSENLGKESEIQFERITSSFEYSEENAPAIIKGTWDIISSEKGDSPSMSYKKSNNEIRTPLLRGSSCTEGGHRYSIYAVSTRTLPVERRVWFGIFDGNEPLEGGVLVIPPFETFSNTAGVLGRMGDLGTLVTTPITVYTDNQIDNAVTFVPIAFDEVNTCDDSTTNGTDDNSSCWDEFMDAVAADDEEFDYMDCVGGRFEDDDTFEFPIPDL